MAVTKEEVRSMIDHLTEEQTEEVYNYITELQDSDEEEMSAGQIKGLFDQDEYLEEGEKKPKDPLDNTDTSRREKL
ncbi:hypothetical protein [Alteribacillus sp. HJP-4]|uniref:hypothetical protein n=1 Tax=Alteribacillus sp. HJP-4 TaxID=2775394 RepID=UPI0035CCFB3F